MGEPCHLHPGGGGAISTPQPGSGDSARDSEHRLGPGGRASLLPGPAGVGGAVGRGCRPRAVSPLPTPPPFPTIRSSAGELFAAPTLAPPCHPFLCAGGLGHSPI